MDRSGRLAMATPALILRKTVILIANIQYLRIIFDLMEKGLYKGGSNYE